MISESLTLDWAKGKKRRVWFRHQDRKCDEVFEAGQESTIFFSSLDNPGKKRKKEKKMNNN